MNFQTLFAASATRTIQTGLVGAGEFGVSFLFQGSHVPGLQVRAACDLNPQKAVEGFIKSGIAPQDIVLCTSEEAMLAAYTQGKYVVVPQALWLTRLPLDVIVESSGNPEAGAQTAEAALFAGKHVIMVSKEVEVAVGPILNHHARSRGLVYTTGEGDQPSLLVGLITWARTLGLDIVCAGKSSEYDFVFDPQTGTVTCNGDSVACPELQKWWERGTRSVASMHEERARITAHFNRRIVPDLCEMCLVANATGMRPDHSIFHAPVARTVELPDVLCPQADGGLLLQPGTIDTFNCLRRPDEASMSGGVFVVVACEDSATWKVLEAKGHPRSRNGKYALLYHPAHLLGVETPISIMAAVHLGQATSGEVLSPICDLAGVATHHLPAGYALHMGGHHHVIEGVDGLLLDSSGMRPDNPVPFYLMSGHTLRRDVLAGEVITYDHVQAPENSTLWRLRKEQDKLFGLIAR